MPPCHLLFRLKKYNVKRTYYNKGWIELNHQKLTATARYYINNILIMRYTDMYYDEHKNVGIESSRYSLSILTNNHRYNCVCYIDSEIIIEYIRDAIVNKQNNVIFEEMLGLPNIELYFDKKNFINISGTWRDIINKSETETETDAEVNKINKSETETDAEVNKINRNIIHYFRDNYQISIYKEKYFITIDTAEFYEDIIMDIDRDIYQEFIEQQGEIYMRNIFGGFENVKIYCKRAKPGLELINNTDINNLTSITREWLLELKNKYLQQQVTKQKQIIKWKKHMIKKLLNKS